MCFVMDPFSLLRRCWTTTNTLFFAQDRNGWLNYHNCIPRWSKVQDFLFSEYHQGCTIFFELLQINYWRNHSIVRIIVFVDLKVRWTERNWNAWRQNGVDPSSIGFGFPCCSNRWRTLLRERIHKVGASPIIEMYRKHINLVGLLHFLWLLSL